MGGSNPTKLHFNVGKEEIAETILTKLDDSKKLAISNAKAASEVAKVESHSHRSTHTPPPRTVESGSPSKKNGASVRFTEKSPEIIPPREPSEDGEAEEEGAGVTGDEEEGELAVALYDFEGTGPDELSVQEGDRLHVIEKEGEEWWKCRNVQGSEGVVPASYLEVGIVTQSYDHFVRHLFSLQVLRLLRTSKLTAMWHVKSENAKKPRRGNAKFESKLTRSGRRLNKIVPRLQRKHNGNSGKRNTPPPPPRP